MDASISGFITLTILGVLKKKKEMNNKKKNQNLSQFELYISQINLM